MAAISGPIVMIGFGSIGKGALPLIERHFEFDHEAPGRDRPDRRRSRDRGDRGYEFIKSAVTKDNYRDLLDPAADARRRPGFLRQSVGGHVLAGDHGAVPRDRRALHRHRGRAVARLLFRQEPRAGKALQLRPARDGAGIAAARIPAAPPPFPPAAPIRAWCPGS